MARDAYLDIFISESLDQLQKAGDDLLLLEKSPSDAGILNRIFRAMHTLKGGAALDGLEKIGDLAHRLENIFGIVRDRAVQLDADGFDTVYAAVDLLTTLVNGLHDGSYATIDPTAVNGRVLSLQQRMQPGEPVAVATSEDDEVALELNDEDRQCLAAECTGERHLYKIRLQFGNAAQMRGLMATIIYNNLAAKCRWIRIFPDSEHLKKNPPPPGEITILALTAISPAAIHSLVKVNCPVFTCDPIEPDSLSAASASMPEPQPGPKPPAAKKTADETAYRNPVIEVDKVIVDGLLDNVGDLVLNMNVSLAMLDEIIENRALDAENLRGELTGFYTQLQTTALVMNAMMDYGVQMRMVPIGMLLKKFPRIVRDTSRKVGKKAALVIKGDRIRLGQEVLEKIEDPLLHMIRNSVDHGLEMPEDRIGLGKPAEGRIAIDVSSSRNTILIRLSDDGHGLDRDRIRRKAVEKELVTADAARALPDRELLRLIFAPGFSTNENVTELSGRGVGMDVVLHNITEIGGTIEIESHPGQGSTFLISVPAAL